MAKSSKSILIGSDFHLGNKVALCSEDPQVADQDNPYVPNKLQMALLQVFNEAKDDIIEKHPTAWVINGEPIDGDNYHSGGVGTWSPDLNDQVNDFQKLYKTLPQPKHLFLVRGSNYHVMAGKTTPIEEFVAKEMKADRHRAYAGKGFTDFECNIEMNGKNFNFTHHVGFAQWEQYRPTSIARELVKMHFEHGRRGWHTDVTVRSHVHYYVEVRFTHTKGFTTPAWKMPDSFMYRRGIPTIPDVGFMEVIVESNGKVIVEPHIIEVNVKPMRSHI